MSAGEAEEEMKKPKSVPTARPCLLWEVDPGDGGRKPGRRGGEPCLDGGWATQAHQAGVSPGNPGRRAILTKCERRRGGRSVEVMGHVNGRRPLYTLGVSILSQWRWRPLGAGWWRCGGILVDSLQIEGRKRLGGGGDLSYVSDDMVIMSHDDGPGGGRRGVLEDIPTQWRVCR